jgi:hypothetical protein
MKVREPNMTASEDSTRDAQLSHFSKRVTYKLARSYVERDAIFKLRYQCYLRAGLISKNSFGRYFEAADHASNAYLIGFYVGRRLISSLRLQIGSPATSNLSSLKIFPKVLQPILERNCSIIDMSCVATDRGLSDLHIWLPYLTLRPWIAAAEHFNADHIVTMARPQHRPFYEHVLGFKAYSHVRRRPGHLGSVALFGLNFVTSATCLYDNYPFLLSTPAERRQLFEPDAAAARASGFHHSAARNRRYPLRTISSPRP